MGTEGQAAGRSGGAHRVAEDSVVVAFDGSPQAAGALRWGAHEAMALSVPLDVVTVWQRPLVVRSSSTPDPAQDYARQLAARAVASVVQGGSARLRVRQHVEEGVPT